MKNNLLNPIMFAGTGSDVGKSIIATGFCRIFKQDGYNPAPFKAQNMALNSYATPDGLEIGMAQAVQAEAAKIPCCSDMNPLLLKPNSDHTSQVILNGKSIGNQSAYSYFKKEGREIFRKAVTDSFNRLQKKYNPIVMEGAGSIAEINLRETDIVNMSMAIAAGANVILVADIERGGVIASIYGSIILMTPQERKHIKGIIINKFRGDIKLFDNGRKIIEELCGIPVLGVIPYFKDIHIEEEDSVILNSKLQQIGEDNNKIKIAIILLNHISNFTDFNTLERDSRVHLFYTNNVHDIKKADLIIIPGSKSTIADLIEIRKNGVAQAIIEAHKNGKGIFGICGGFQILGREIQDPHNIEGATSHLPGLGILPVSTIMQESKITEQIKFINPFIPDKTPMNGYEIHIGNTTIDNNAKPLNIIIDNSGNILKEDGCYVEEKCIGTYIHGILGNQQFINYLLQPYIKDKKEQNNSFNYKEYKEIQYNKLADEIRKHVNIEYIYKIMKEGL